MVKTAESLYWSREGHLSLLVRLWSRITVAPRQQFNIHLSALPLVLHRLAGCCLLSQTDTVGLAAGTLRRCQTGKRGLQEGRRSVCRTTGNYQLLLPLHCASVMFPPSVPRHPLGSGGKLRADFRRGGRNHRQDYLALGILLFFTKACLSLKKKTPATLKTRRVFGGSNKQSGGTLHHRHLFVRSDSGLIKQFSQSRKHSSKRHMLTEKEKHLCRHQVTFTSQTQKRTRH